MKQYYSFSLISCIITALTVGMLLSCCGQRATTREQASNTLNPIIFTDSIEDTDVLSFFGLNLTHDQVLNGFNGFKKKLRLHELEMGNNYIDIDTIVTIISAKSLLEFYISEEKCQIIDSRIEDDVLKLRHDSIYIGMPLSEFAALMNYTTTLPNTNVEIECLDVSEMAWVTFVFKRGMLKTIYILVS